MKRNKNDHFYFEIIKQTKSRPEVWPRPTVFSNKKHYDRRREKENLRRVYE